MNGGATTTYIDTLEKLELCLFCLTTHSRFAQMGGILTLKLKLAIISLFILAKIQKIII